MNYRIPQRLANLAGFACCTLLLAYAYYVQFHLRIDPCPLCIFQRLAFLLVGVVFLAAAVHDPGVRGSRVYAVLVFASAALGAAIAGRHVWLQHLPPDKVPACGAGLDYLLETIPLAQVVRSVLTGSGECAKVDWTFLGLSMPAWALVWFIVLGGWGAMRNWRRAQS